MARWSNWSGTVNYDQLEHTYHPETMDELRAAVRDAIQRKWRVRVVGQGHSWSNLVVPSHSRGAQRPSVLKQAKHLLGGTQESGAEPDLRRCSARAGQPHARAGSDRDHRYHSCRAPEARARGRCVRQFRDPFLSWASRQYVVRLQPTADTQSTD